MTPKEIISRVERIRAEVNSYAVPIFYGSKVAPLKRMANDMLVLMRELAQSVEQALNRPTDDKPEGKI